MVTFEAQILTVILWIAAIKFCQVTVYPYLRPALHNLSYGLAYPIGILLLTLISWYLGLIGVPVQFALLFFLIIGALAFYKKQYSREDFKKNLIWDVIFLAAFALMLTVRWFTPGIIPSGEKFMDAAFLGSIMQNPIVTPSDPWFAGENLSIYYYLCHWMCAVLGIISFGASTIVFNLMIPTAFALAAVSAYAVGVLILKRHKWIPMLVLIIPNIALLVESFSGNGLISIWWESTRVIGDGATINEYPLFSFLWGDPHAHVIACFNQILFICLMMVMLKRWGCLSNQGRYLLIIISAISLGAMPVMNSWDVLVYAAVYLVIAFITWWNYFNHKITFRAIFPFALVPVLSIICCALPLLNMVLTGGSSVQGFFLVTTPSPFLEFIQVWGLFLAIFIIYGFSVIKKYPWLILIPVLCFLLGYGSLGTAVFCLVLILLKKENKPETTFAIIGLALLIFMEVFYLKDYMGDAYYRMNTVFKLGFCAWFILGLSSFLIVGKWFRNKITPLNFKQKSAVVLVILIALAAMFVTCGVNLGYPGGSLDGKMWLETYHSGDSVGIDYLLENADADDVVVEAVGTSYEYSSRVSVMTGLSTIIGWAGHEAGWRTGIEDADISARMSDVQTIYENPLKCISLMKKYGADYIFVGENERELYNVNLPEGLTEVFSFEGTVIYKLA
ncbi:MAG: DUF2298 domain-containing protein [Methanocorpusculum sp.]|nr:DUF2298 domain-containing protein [Methanocorpusculum sp.]